MIVDTKNFWLVFFYANDSRFHEESYLLEHSVSSLIELGVAILTNSSNLVILELIGISLGHPSRSSISFILGSGLLFKKVDNLLMIKFGLEKNSS